MVALGIGSRGIAGIAGMARAAVDTLKELGYKPFIVAAMGSHGGATAEGQRALLASFDVTAEAMGVAVKTDMDAVVLETNPVGLPIYFDRNAHQADGIVLINRVKPHTDFHATHESGVLKMLVLGLGKLEGASRFTGWACGNERGSAGGGPVPGREYSVRAGTGHPGECRRRARGDRAHRAGDHLRRRAEAAGASPGPHGPAPFDQIDVLIVGELGKNYSGAGMDPNVIGRLMVETQSDFERPVITRLAVLDVSDESHGNIVGVGFADLTTQRLVSRMDPEPFRINVLTSCFLERARIPITLPTDREVIESALETCWRIDSATARMVVIPNTLELKTLWVSPPLEDEVRNHPHLKRDTEYLPIPLSPGGTLDQAAMFPHSIHALRGKGSRS